MSKWAKERISEWDFWLMHWILWLVLIFFFFWRNLRRSIQKDHKDPQKTFTSIKLQSKFKFGSLTSNVFHLIFLFFLFFVLFAISNFSIDAYEFVSLFFFSPSFGIKIKTQMSLASFCTHRFANRFSELISLIDFFLFLIIFHSKLDLWLYLGDHFNSMINKMLIAYLMWM